MRPTHRLTDTKYEGIVKLNAWIKTWQSSHVFSNAFQRNHVQSIIDRVIDRREYNDYDRDLLNQLRSIYLDISDVLNE
mgnify:CR=1 FL=1